MTVTVPPPLPVTGHPATDEDLALMRQTTEAIRLRQEEVEELSRERMAVVLRLRERGVLFSVIAEAVPTTEQTVYKIARTAKRERAHAGGDHSRCSAGNCQVIADQEAAQAAQKEAGDA